MKPREPAAPPGHHVLGRLESTLGFWQRFANVAEIWWTRHGSVRAGDTAGHRFCALLVDASRALAALADRPFDQCVNKPLASGPMDKGMFRSSAIVIWYQEHFGLPTDEHIFMQQDAAGSCEATFPYGNGAFSSESGRLWTTRIAARRNAPLG